MASKKQEKNSTSTVYRTRGHRKGSVKPHSRFSEVARGECPHCDARLDDEVACLNGYGVGATRTCSSCEHKWYLNRFNHRCGCFTCKTLSGRHINRLPEYMKPCQACGHYESYLTLYREHNLCSYCIMLWQNLDRQISRVSSWREFLDPAPLVLRGEI